MIRRCNVSAMCALVTPRAVYGQSRWLWSRGSQPKLGNCPYCSAQVREEELGGAKLIKSGDWKFDWDPRLTLPQNGVRQSSVTDMSTETRFSNAD